MNFDERYKTYTDDQLIQVLKNHKDYQPDAVAAAVKIAVERQLINSEQDLLSIEIQSVRTVEFGLFPQITNEYQRIKLIGSIFRFTYVLAFLPVIFGFLKYAEGQINLTFAGVGVGLIWLLLCFWLSKTRKMILFLPLFLLLFAVSGFVVINLFNSESFRILDAVMLVIGTILPIYLLLLLKRLLQ
jgi:hypothetical protein